MIERKPRLVYDGVCNLCTGAVRFLNAIDRKHVVEFAPYQLLDPETTRRFALSAWELQGRMHMIRRDGVLVKGAAAVSEVCRLLAPVNVLCNLFDTALAQKLYDFIARKRYTLFGCRSSCYLPGDRRVSV